MDEEKKKTISSLNSMVSVVTEIVKKGSNKSSKNGENPSAMENDEKEEVKTNKSSGDASTVASFNPSTVAVSANDVEGLNEEEEEKAGEDEDLAGESNKKSIKKKIMEKLNPSSNDNANDDAGEEEEEEEAQQEDTGAAMPVNDEESKQTRDKGQSFDLSETVTKTTMGTMDDVGDDDNTSVSSLNALIEKAREEWLPDQGVMDSEELLQSTTLASCGIDPLGMVSEIKDAVSEVEQGIKNSVKNFIGSAFPMLKISPNQNGRGEEQVEMILDVLSFEQDLKQLDCPSNVSSDLSDNSYFFRKQELEQEKEEKDVKNDKKSGFGKKKKVKTDYDDSTVISWKDLASYSKEDWFYH